MVGGLAPASPVTATGRSSPDTGLGFGSDEAITSTLRARLQGTGRSGAPEMARPAAGLQPAIGIAVVKNFLQAPAEGVPPGSVVVALYQAFGIARRGRGFLLKYDLDLEGPELASGK